MCRETTGQSALLYGTIRKSMRDNAIARAGRQIFRDRADNISFQGASRSQVPKPSV